jgi:branched-chain amino acid transport system ATP-binding protein
MSASHNAPLLEIDKLRVRYGKVEALHEVNLKLERGSIATVIGPNGAGKSTLLNAIMGVLPAQGEIRYQGRSLQRDSL